jgi:hypothetical protein
MKQKGPKLMVHTPGNITAVRAPFQQRPVCSAWKHSEAFGVFHQTLKWILCLDFQFHPSRVQVFQVMSDHVKTSHPFSCSLRYNGHQYCPVFSALDIVLWGHLKDQVCHMKPNTVEELKERITKEVWATVEDLRCRVVENLLKRLQECTQNEADT